MIKRFVVGDETSINKEVNEKKVCLQLITTAASMNEDDLKSYFDNHFSSLPDKVKEGIEMMLKLSWANSKALNYLLNKF